MIKVEMERAIKKMDLRTLIEHKYFIEERIKNFIDEEEFYKLV